MSIPDGGDVVDEVRSELTTVLSTVMNLPIHEKIDEDEFHSVMTELLSKVITLYLDYCVKIVRSF